MNLDDKDKRFLDKAGREYREQQKDTRRPRYTMKKRLSEYCHCCHCVKRYCNCSCCCQRGRGR